MTLPAPTRIGRQQATSDEYDDGPFTFRPATKDGFNATVAIQGPSGSGKTWTGLSIASGLAEGERFAVIDTERGAAALYVNDLGVAFDTLPMHRYDPRDLQKALAAAAQAGYRVVMVDSLSHFWKGTDGTLDQVEKAKSKYGGNKFAGWKDGTPLQNEMIEALMSYPGHVVVTMRSYVHWVLENGSPVNKGMRAEQRKGIEFEFGVAAEMDENNRLRFIKSRCPSFRGLVLNQPHGAKDIAKPYLDWLRDGGKETDPSAWIDAANAPDATPDGLLALYREVEAARALATPLLHPDTGAPISLGELIKERGTALKAASAA
ncbi:AAA family ATPase [Streptomyces griseus]|uniref:AAA family ATPase n=1 Tax=Streptomyces TaxID=1883 RepID=UPI0001C1C407|nr:AAA family ATPase [Streptomyces sp. ACT-1]EGE40844.1 AAA ATPase [Streptomyces sp. ACT-1]MYR48910.1 AAA family ATPase [Streptomyces sp. SID4928]